MKKLILTSLALISLSASASAIENLGFGAAYVATLLQHENVRECLYGFKSVEIPTDTTVFQVEYASSMEGIDYFFSGISYGAINDFHWEVHVEDLGINAEGKPEYRCTKKVQRKDK